MKRILYPLIGLGLAGVTALQVNSMRAESPSTQHTVQVAQPTRVIAEGRYVAHPGAEVDIGSEVSGVVERVLVREKDRVNKGDVLVELSSDDIVAAIREAEAREREADADIRLYEVERERMKDLWEQQVGSRQAWDRAERDLESAIARRASARAERNRLAAVREKYLIRSPIDGAVVSRSVDPGEAVSAGDTVIAVADLSQTRVEAEVDEYDAARVSLNAPVVVRAEGFAGKWRGTVSEVPDVVVSRRLKPQDPARPIDTRVLLVKVELGSETPLKLGQRVEVEIGADGSSS